MKRSFFSLICLSAVTLLLTTPVVAQVTTGTLLGRVLDQSGLGVPGAEVVAVNEQTSTTKKTLTGDTGTFTITFLPVGRYTVRVEMPGFKSVTQPGLEISAGQKLDVTYTLEVGEISEIVTVSGRTPLLNTVNAEQDVGLNTLQVQNLPVPRRDWTTILMLGPGTGSGGGQISLNGLPP